MHTKRYPICCAKTTALSTYITKREIFVCTSRNIQIQLQLLLLCFYASPLHSESNGRESDILYMFSPCYLFFSKTKTKEQKAAKIKKVHVCQIVYTFTVVSFALCRQPQRQLSIQIKTKKSIAQIKQPLLAPNMCTAQEYRYKKREREREKQSEKISQKMT